MARGAGGDDLRLAVPQHGASQLQGRTSRPFPPSRRRALARGPAHRTDPTLAAAPPARSGDGPKPGPLKSQAKDVTDLRIVVYDEDSLATHGISRTTFHVLKRKSPGSEGTMLPGD